MGHENDDMYGDMHMSGEFDDGQALNTGATEAMIARHHSKQKKAEELAQRYQKGNSPRFLSRAWFNSIRPAPLNHIKNNYGTILTTTTLTAAGAAAGAYALTKALSVPPDVLSVAKTTLLGYMGYRLLDGGLAAGGFWYGHYKNARGRDRFHEVKTEPAGRWLGRTAWAGAVVAGGFAGHTYWDAVENVTIHAPSTVLQGAPSFVVDTTTHGNNTGIDAMWELDDQAYCLQQLALNDDHNCLTGPGSEAFTVENTDTHMTIVIDKAALHAAGGNEAEIGYIGRGLQAIGVDPETSFDWMPELPSRKSVNQWARQSLGLN